MRKLLRLQIPFSYDWIQLLFRCHFRLDVSPSNPFGMALKKRGHLPNHGAWRGAGGHELNMNTQMKIPSVQWKRRWTFFPRDFLPLRGTPVRGQAEGVVGAGDVPPLRLALLHWREQAPQAKAFLVTTLGTAGRTWSRGPGQRLRGEWPPCGCKDGSGTPSVGAEQQVVVQRICVYEGSKQTTSTRATVPRPSIMLLL